MVFGQLLLLIRVHASYSSPTWRLTVYDSTQHTRRFVHKGLSEFRLWPRCSFHMLFCKECLAFLFLFLFLERIISLPLPVEDPYGKS